MILRNWRETDEQLLAGLASYLMDCGAGIAPEHCWLRAWYCAPDHDHPGEETPLVWVSFASPHREAFADVVLVGEKTVEVRFKNGQRLQTDDLHVLLEALDRYQRRAEWAGSVDYPVVPKVDFSTRDY